MKLDNKSDVPIYRQIANYLEKQILNGHFQVDDKLYSQYQLADMFEINPATAAKGLTLLADEKIAYDKRGLGKFVSQDAKQIIIEKRKNEILNELLEKVVSEAVALNITEAELMTHFQEKYKAKRGMDDD